MRSRARLCMLLLSLTTLGCGDIQTYTAPRPTDARFITWLEGEKIVVEKGLIFNSTWTIEKGEVSDFKIINVTRNSADMVYSAMMSFRVIAQNKGLYVQGVCRYQPGKEKDTLVFVDFTPTSNSKIGNW
jgi:hypothetical protein